MDRGEREAKRMRGEYLAPSVHSPTPYSAVYPPRDLPPPSILGPPLSQQPPAPPRRHSSHLDEVSSAYNNGYVSRDPIMKQDPGLDQRLQPDVMRPNSNSQYPPLHRARVVDDVRTVYDHPNMSNVSISAAAQYMAPPPQYGSDRPYFDSAMSEVSREQPWGIELLSSSSSGHKKRSARTTQACEACRHAKAKCTDPKPCQGCVEKNILCKYDPPPPKQSDKVNSEVSNQIESLRSYIDKDIKAMNRKIDMILSILAKVAPEATNTARRERPMKSEEEDTGASVQPSIEGGDDSDEIDDELKRDESVRDPELQQREHSIPPVDPTYFKELASDTGVPKNYYSGVDTFGHAAIDTEANGGDDVIPLRHTTGSHYALQWPSVIKVWQGAHVKPESVAKFDPYTTESNRGIVHIHGRGEGPGPIPLDSNFARETTSFVSVDGGSECAPSPTVERSSWGVFGSTPGPESPTQLSSRYNPHGLLPDRSPPFDEATVRELAELYMTTMNIMHPIITKHGKEQLIRLFLQDIALQKRDQGESQVAATFMRATSKRKRDSPSVTTTFADEHIRLPYRMETANMLLILALGKICEYKKAIPAPPPALDGLDAVSPPSITKSQSPSPALRFPTLSHSATAHLPPLPGLPAHEFSSNKNGRRKYPPDVKNVDVIPGLAYFALAVNIMGDHEGEHDLPMVHACLLAALYHGQLGRPLQSYHYIFKAGVSMQWKLQQPQRAYFAGRPRIEEDETIPGTREHIERFARKRKENHTLFAFWTCMQLESDILAELDCPKQSGILQMQAEMPWPDVDVAFAQGDMDANSGQFYLCQLSLRDHLNTMHKDLYGPIKTLDYAPERLLNEDYVNLKLVPNIEAMVVNLNKLVDLPSLARWAEGAPPADNILEARLRGKYYGGLNITHRHFLRAVLDNSKPGVRFPPKVLEYAKTCVFAMKSSCMAFSACTKPGERLIVTNSWGTAHAQWGNTVVLHAVYANELLNGCITTEELIEITTVVWMFLETVAQHGSALEVDLQFLDAVARSTGVLDMVKERMRQRGVLTSFSTNGSFDGKGTSLTPTGY